jgi:hypothetical protein
VKRTAVIGADVAAAPGADFGLEAVLDRGLLIARVVFSNRIMSYGRERGRGRRYAELARTPPHALTHALVPLAVVGAKSH